MLTIRRGQMTAFQADLESRAVRRCIEFLRLRFPGLDPAIAARIEDLVVRSRCAARQLGFKREDDLRTFASLSVDFGEDFHLQRWAEVLHRMEILPSDRMSALRQDLLSLGMYY
jgi:hypothetical protein